MSRSVFIAVSVGVLLLVLIGALRLTGDVPTEVVVEKRDRRAATGSGSRDGARASGVARTDRDARRPQGGAAGVAERRRTVGASGEGTPRTGSAWAGAGQSEAGGGAAIGGRRPRGLIDDDSGFRAAAERLAEMGPSRATPDDDEPADEVVVPEPPMTPVADDSMTALSPPDQAVAPGTVSDVSLRTRVLAPDEISRLFERAAFRGRSP